MIIQKDMVIDAFPGFNEVELAEFRISYLKDVVDKVIIVESELTHSGLSKPLYFANWLANQSQTMKFLEKFIINRNEKTRIIRRDLVTIPLN